jgi:hypothetical protein
MTQPATLTELITSITDTQMSGIAVVQTIFSGYQIEDMSGPARHLLRAAMNEIALGSLSRNNRIVPGAQVTLPRAVSDYDLSTNTLRSDSLVSIITREAGRRR